MKLKLTHKETGYEAIVDNSTGKIEITGNHFLVKGLNEYFDSFKNSYYLSSEVEYAFREYGEDLMIKDGNVYSVNTSADKFLTNFFTKEMEDAGYIVEQI